MGLQCSHHLLPTCEFEPVFFENDVTDVVSEQFLVCMMQGELEAASGAERTDGAASQAAPQNGRPSS